MVCAYVTMAGGHRRWRGPGCGGGPGVGGGDRRAIRPHRGLPPRLAPVRLPTGGAGRLPPQWPPQSPGAAPGLVPSPLPISKSREWSPAISFRALPLPTLNRDLHTFRASAVITAARMRDWYPSMPRNTKAKCRLESTRRPGAPALVELPHDPLDSVFIEPKSTYRAKIGYLRCRTASVDSISEAALVQSIVISQKLLSIVFSQRFLPL